MPNVILPLKIAKDDPTKDAIAFEGRGTKTVWDKTKGQQISIPKWHWLARSKILTMEDRGNGLVNVTVPEWLAKKQGLVD